MTLARALGVLLRTVITALGLSLILGASQVAPAKNKPGWKRGRVHVRTVAKAMATIVDKNLGPELQHQPSAEFQGAFARLKPQTRRGARFPWRARKDGKSIYKGLIRFLPVMDNKGWIRRRDVREVYGQSTLAMLDEVLRRSDGGRALSGWTWAELMSKAPDKMLGAMSSGQRIVPRMRAFDAIVKRFGKLKPTYLDMRGQIVGNTAALLLRGGSKPRRTRVYGKSYSFEARAGAFLHVRGYRVEGTRFRDGRQHLEELTRQQEALYTLLDKRAAAGDIGAAKLRRALEAYGGLLRDDPWAQVERDELQRVYKRIDAKLATIRHPERIKRAIFQIVDDGGDYLEAVGTRLKQPKYARYRHLFCGVEQTTKGHRKMEKLKAPFPVVSVAQSWAKNTYGNPMFGHAIAKQTHAMVAELKAERRIRIPPDSRVIDYPRGVMLNAAGAPLERAPGGVGDAKQISLGRAAGGRVERVGGLELPKEAVVVGANGRIGQAVIRSLLAAGYKVSGYDKKGVKNPPRGLRVFGSLDAALAAGKVLISATGTQTIGPAELDKLPDGAVVINGGSAGEFFLPRDPARQALLGPASGSPLARLPEATRRALHRAVQLNRGGSLRPFELAINREHFIRFKGRLLPQRGADPHEVWVTAKGKEILVARGGGVINFPMDVSHPRAGKLIPGRYIQLELGLLHLAMLQAQRERRPGLRPLERPPQEVLLREVQRDLATRGESLLQPSF